MPWFEVLQLITSHPDWDMPANESLSEADDDGEVTSPKDTRPSEEPSQEQEQVSRRTPGEIFPFPSKNTLDYIFL